MKTDALKHFHEDEKYFPAGQRPNPVIASIFTNYVRRSLFDPRKTSGQKPPVAAHPARLSAG
jgi:hypothetical protein